MPIRTSVGVPILASVGVPIRISVGVPILTSVGVPIRTSVRVPIRRRGLGPGRPLRPALTGRVKVRCKSRCQRASQTKDVQEYVRFSPKTVVLIPRRGPSYVPGMTRCIVQLRSTISDEIQARRFHTVHE